MIDARALIPAETGAAATNACNTAMALATTEAARLAIKMLKATSGVFSLVGKARNLLAIVAGEVGLSGFPRLKKLTATGPSPPHAFGAWRCGLTSGIRTTPTPCLRQRACTGGGVWRCFREASR